jgi:hypothetical protein
MALSAAQPTRVALVAEAAARPATAAAGWVAAGYRVVSPEEAPAVPRPIQNQASACRDRRSPLGRHRQLTAPVADRCRAKGARVGWGGAETAGVEVEG